MSALKNRKLAAILFADIVGYTAIMQQDEAHAIHLLEKYNQVLATALQNQNGQLLQDLGDGSLCLFDSAIAAVRCAIQLQREWAANPNIPVRIGIHLGDVVFQKEKIYGDGVNIASRIESLAIPGAIFYSGSVYLAIKSHSDIQSTLLGNFDFKNVNESMAVYALSNEGFPVPNASQLSGKIQLNQVKRSPNYLKWLIPLSLVTIIGFSAIQWFLLKPSNNKNTELETATNEHTIAVLAFKDLSPKGDQEYFADGVSEELLNVLTKIKALKVSSRTSSFAFKQADRSIPDIAKLLDVKYVLEGSVRKADNQLRITAQLIDGTSDKHIWSETYDRKLEAIFELQDEIAGAIVTQVNQLIGNNGQAITRIDFSTSNLSAYDLYLKAENLEGEESVERNWKIIALLEQAVLLDPSFVDAWASLGIAYWMQSSWLNTDATELVADLLKKAKKSSIKALQLDPNNSTAQLTEEILLAETFQWTEALEKFKLSDKNEIKPQWFHKMYADVYQALGYFDKAIPIYEQALAVDPDDPYTHNFSALAYISNGQYEQAKVHFVRSRMLGYSSINYTQLIDIYKEENQKDIIHLLLVEIVPHNISPMIPYFMEIILAKDEEAKLAAIQTFWLVVKERGIDPVVVKSANYYLEVYLGEYDRVTTGFSSLLLTWLWTPFYKEYRQTDDFKQIIKDSKVLAYWQANGFPPQCRDLGNGDFECD